jgi:hypothetical protein
MADNSANAKHFARDDQRRITAATASGIDAFMLVQFSMLRMWTHDIERFAGNYQRALDETYRPVRDRAANAALL